MKKLMISMMAVAVASVSFANAATVSTPLASKVITINQEKVEVKPEELPDAVKTALAAAPYNEWKVGKAYSVSGTDGAQHFEIELSKGEETATVKLDKDGKKVE